VSKPTTSISRLLQIRKVIKQHDLVDLLDDLNLSKSARLSVRLLFGTAKDSNVARGERIRLALEALGPVFVKLGQTLSTRPDLLPADIAEELTKLQDQVPAFSSTEALELIKHQPQSRKYMPPP